MLDLIVVMQEQSRGSIMQRKILFRMYDQDGDGVLGRREITDLLYKITAKNLPAMSLK